MSKYIKQTLEKKIPKTKGYIISLAFTGHDASITIAKNSEILEVIEVERFMNMKNADFTDKPAVDIQTKSLRKLSSKFNAAVLNSISNYISKKYTDVFDLGLYVDRLKSKMMDDSILHFTDFFKVKNDNWHFVSHHLAHACGAFFQSDYEESLVFCVDGGSIDNTTNIFKINKDGDIVFFEKEQEELYYTNTEIGKLYSRMGYIFRDIKLPKINYSLTYPGKIMSLASYGQPNEKIVSELMRPNLYHIIHSDFLRVLFIEWYNMDAIKKVHQQKSISGVEAYNFAASLQKAFEETILNVIGPFLKEFPNLPICISGGCALNIPFNTRLVEEFDKNVFVPPDPNDCGLSLGAMLYYLKPKKPYNNPYSGQYLLDIDLLPTYLYEDIGISSVHYDVETLNGSLDKLVDNIINGKIIGIAHGRCERGPRALGNRSIICSVLYPNMKDVINEKVKNREWFRPFAPIVRLEDVTEYFHWNRESRYMTFSPKVRENWREKIKPVVHINGTSRVQTITKEQNEFIYELLTELDKKTGVGIVLNTSFNVDSKPIISSIKDAIKVLKETKLDGIMIENVLIMKKSNT